MGGKSAPQDVSTSTWPSTQTCHQETYGWEIVTYSAAKAAIRATQQITSKWSGCLGTPYRHCQRCVDGLRNLVGVVWVDQHRSLKRQRAACKLAANKQNGEVVSRATASQALHVPRQTQKQHDTTRAVGGPDRGTIQSSTLHDSTLGTPASITFSFVILSARCFLGKPS